MTNDQLLSLRAMLDERYERDYKNFCKLMEKIDPHFNASPYEKFLMDNKNFSQEELSILWEIKIEIEKEQYDEQYKNLFAHVDSILYPYLYLNAKGLTEEEKRFAKSYSRIIHNRSLINYSLNQTNDLDDTKALNFEVKDIIITDPGYVFSKDWDTDWTNLLTNYIYHDSLVGDWSAAVFKSNAKDIYEFFNLEREEPLGRFCADAGMVGVFDLDEVLNYDPNFKKDYLSKDFLVARINNFTGSVRIRVDYVDEEFIAYVEGKGNINFYGIQTGF